MSSVSAGFSAGLWPLALIDSAVDLVPVVGVLLIIASLVISMRKRRQQQAGQPTARERLERMNQTQGMRDDLQSLMVEIEQMARRLSSQLDSKTMHLEKLLDEADQRIAELRRLQGEPTEPTQGSGAEPASRQTFDTPSGAETGHEPTGGAPADQLARARAAAPQAGAQRATPARQGAPAASEDPLTRSIYALADEGKSASQIAGELNEHVGKVELILALRQT